MTARITVDGNLVADPDFGVGDSGSSWAHLRVASHERIRRDGQWISTDPEFYNITLFGATAETAANDLRKGDRVTVQGRPQLETFDRRDGTHGAEMKVYARTVAKTEPAETGTDPRLARDQGRGAATTGPGSAPVIHHTADATAVVGVARTATALHKTLKDNGFRWSTATASWNLPADLDEHTRTARVGEVLSTVRANGRDLTVVHHPAPSKRDHPVCRGREHGSGAGADPRAPHRASPVSTAPAFDPAVFGGDPQTPPVPMVICWDELDPAGYARTLRDLADWIDWFRRTYRVPATVIPPCWFTHPGIREDLGHLWTGWLLTRHPDAGVGMTGLDWDARWEQAIARLREATAITGCTSTRHHDEPPIPDTDLSRLWNEHIADDAHTRRRRDAQRIIVDVVTEHLQAAELRNDLASGLLTELAADPAAATAEERAAIAARLHQISKQAAATANQIATDASRTVADQHDLAGRETRVEAARRRIAETAIGDASDANDSDSAAARREWLIAIENLLPTALAVERAAATATARRTDSTKPRTATLRRHLGVEDLLNREDDPMSSEN